MLLTEEQTLIRDTARAFAQDKVAPHVRAWEAAGEIPRALLSEMGQLGFMGMCVPAEWGGAEAGMLSYVLALEEIAAADGGLSTVMSVNNSPDCAALLAYGSPEQKERWLKPLARGGILGAFCLTEPQAGSDASNLKTRAERRGNGWGVERRKAVHHLRPHGRHRPGLRRHRSVGRQARHFLLHRADQDAGLSRGVDREEIGAEIVRHLPDCVRGVHGRRRRALGNGRRGLSHRACQS